VTKVIEKETPWCDAKVGDVVEYDEITEYYAGGRIDFWNNLEPDSMFPDEMAVPVMRLEDWQAFGKWLETFETDFPWTLAQLVELYERNNPKIRWWKDESNN
jgi:hypothetical protein